MAREYKEQSTEYLRGQNANPIVSVHLKVNICFWIPSDNHSPVYRRKATRAREWFTRGCNQEHGHVGRSVDDLSRVCRYEGMENTLRIDHSLDALDA